MEPSGTGAGRRDAATGRRSFLGRMMYIPDTPYTLLETIMEVEHRLSCTVPRCLAQLVGSPRKSPTNAYPVGLSELNL